MSLVVVGSVAFDAVETPFGHRERILGGAATHFSLAASFFTDVRVVGVVGDDFGEEELAVFRRPHIDTEDLERVDGGKTFFWAGRYDWDLNTAHTLETDLNVFADFRPKLSKASRAARTLFLANIQPDLQREVREQCGAASFVGLDSMNYWIDTARDSLFETISCVDAVLLNDSEVRMLTGEASLARAAKELRRRGPSVVVCKEGEYGAAVFTDDGVFSLPGYPLETAVDPTGAGDAFAGGFFGYLASRAPEPLTDSALRCATVYGSVLGSFNVEGFGTERIQRLTSADISTRFDEFKRLTHFEPLPAVGPRRDIPAVA